MQLVDVVNQVVDEAMEAFEAWIAETQTIISHLGTADDNDEEDGEE
jgi:hypothetical protein